MRGIQIIYHLLALWTTSGFLFRKNNYQENKESLFKCQDWSIWITPLFVTIIYLGMAIVRFLSALHDGNSLSLPYAMYIQLFLFVGVLWFCQRFFKLSYTTLGLYLDQWPFRLIFGLRWIVGYFFVLYGLFASFFISWVSPEKYDQLLLSMDFQRGNIIARYIKFFEESWGVYTLWIPVLFIVVFRPVSEEIIYRGLLYGPIRKKVGPWFGIFVTSFLFMLAHGLFSLQLFLYGIFFAYLYERTQSLVPGIVCHALINSTFVIDYFLGGPVSYIHFKTQVGWMTVSLALLFILVDFTYRWMRRNGGTFEIPNSILQQS